MAKVAELQVRPALPTPTLPARRAPSSPKKGTLWEGEGALGAIQPCRGRGLAPCSTC